MPVSVPEIEVKIITEKALPNLPPDYVYVGLTWNHYISLAQYLNEIRFKFEEYNAVLDVYEAMVTPQIQEGRP